MKIPRDLSGEDLVVLLCKNCDYRSVHQEGSHMVFETGTPTHQRIAVPAHKNPRIGTLNVILRVVACHKGVARQDVLKSL